MNRMSNEEQLIIALDLLGLKRQVVKIGRTIQGSEQLYKMLGVDGAYTEYNIEVKGVNEDIIENPVFYHIPSVLEKYRISPVEAKTILLLMKGAFSQDDNKKLLVPVCEVLAEMPPESSFEDNKLKWIASSSALAFIVRELVGKGYIEAPTKGNGDINYTALADCVLTSFNGDPKCLGKKDTLAKSLSPDNEKGLVESSKNKFTIPFYMEISKDK